ncbi:MAG: flagellar motor switch protein FliN [Aquificae bacterium]|nr:flagellar motor switch protein FliN [Aquificota bacterium]
MVQSSAEADTEREEEKAQQEEDEQVEQDELAKQWEQMIQQQQEGESHQEDGGVDQEKLAEEWEKMAQASAQEVDQNVDQEDLAKQWEEALTQQADQPPIGEIEGIEKEKLDILMDIPLEISVEIGSTVMPLEEILKLNPNSIVELDRYIDQPVDIKVNGKLIAKGELYTVENNFGIRITSIITVQERMKLLTNGES